MRGSIPAFLQVLMNEYTMAARYADASLPQKSQFLRPYVGNAIMLAS